jgi:hypothetical protein
MRMHKRYAITGFQAGVLLLLTVVVISMLYYVYVSTRPGGVVGPTQTQSVAYNLGIQWTASNDFTGASLTATNPVVNAYQYQGPFGSLSSLYGVTPIASGIAAGSTGVSVPVSLSSQTAQHVLISVYAGDAQYPDVAKLLASNSFIDAAKWMPVTTTSRNDLVLSVNLAALAAPNLLNNPSQTLVLNIPEVPQTTLSSIAITCVQCTSTGTGTGKIVSLGTSANTIQSITFRIAGVAANQGFAVTRIFFTSNQTVSNIITPSQLSFGDNQPIIFPSAPVYSATPSAFLIGTNSFGRSVITAISYGNALVSSSSSGVPGTWEFWPGLTSGFPTNQLSSAIVFGNPSNGPGDTTVSESLTLNLPSSGAVSFVFQFMTITGSGTTASGTAGQNMFTVTLASGANT